MEKERLLDLKEISALPLAVRETGEIVAFLGLERVIPETRGREDLREVFPFLNGQVPFRYLVYRDLALGGDLQVLREQGFRFDLTSLPPGTWGEEYSKTHGHYHPPVPGVGLTYAEVYEVYAGRAYFLLQRPGLQAEELEDFVVVEALPGDKVLIPPGYGHVTVNVGREPLVVGNLVARDFEGLYEEWKRLGGAGYYVRRRGGVPVLEPNPRYRFLPRARKGDARCPALYGVQDLPLYLLALVHPERFAFLRDPREVLRW